MPEFRAGSPEQVAYLDELDFRYVKVPVARVAGMETGQF